MRNSMRMGFFLLLFGILGMMGLQAQSQKFVGVWVAEESSVQYTITKGAGGFVIKALDNSDGEVLEVSKVRGMGKKGLGLVLHTPSTDYTVELRFKLVDSNHFRETIVGIDDFEGNYRRK